MTDSLKVDPNSLKPAPAAPDHALVEPAPPQPAGQATKSPHPEYFSKIEIRRPEDPRRLDFVRSPGSPPPPPDFRDLIKQIQDVGRLVVTLFPDDLDRRRDFFGQLHATADSGLRGRESSIEIGLDNLNEVKGSIADTFPLIRHAVWLRNLIILVIALLVCLPFGGFIYYIAYIAEPGRWVTAPQANELNWIPMAIAAFWIPLGVTIGLFLEFIFRVGDDISYEQLRSINPGRWKPLQRSVNTVILAYTFAGILAVGAFQVGVANVLLNEFSDKKPFLSLAVGFVTGIAFPYVRDLVQQFRPIRRDQAT